MIPEECIGLYFLLFGGHDSTRGLSRGAEHTAVTLTCSNAKARPNPSVPGMRRTLAYVFNIRRVTNHRNLDSWSCGDGDPNTW